MSSNETAVLCPTPFINQNIYPPIGGAINSRLCVPFLTAPGMPTCCLPCPKQNFFYPDHFQTLVHASVFVDLASVICCCFLILSFIVLPVEYTRRHYLSVCLAISILFMQLSFVIPLGVRHSQCYDPITPHDMNSSAICGISGALLLGGGWCTVMWVFLRTLSLHLQICWQLIPGRKFFLAAQAFGWSIPVALLAVTLSLTGVSFRFGESCHINSKQGLQTFWAPLLSVAAASIVTQSITFGYCIQVYLRSLFEEKGSSQHTGGSGLPNGSVRTITARQAFRRIQRVVALQWRGVLIVVLILADNVYFATVFLKFEGTTKKTKENILKGFMWANCIAQNGGDKYKCLHIARELVIEEGNALAVLFLLSFNGILALVLLGRPSIYRGWYEVIKSHLSKPKKEFLSYDARQTSEPRSSTYEMLEKEQGLSRTDTARSIVKPPAPSILRSNTSELREYNPATFSAQMRERLEPKAGEFPPFSPYADSATSPFSPFKDHPEYFSKTASPNVQFSPYTDSPLTPAAPSHSSPGSRRTGGIGIAK